MTTPSVQSVQSSPVRKTRAGKTWPPRVVELVGVGLIVYPVVALYGLGQGHPIIGALSIVVWGLTGFVWSSRR